MRTTIEIPDDLFRKAKASAALRGETLREFICDALITRLGSTGHGVSGWRSVFGLAKLKTVRRIDALLDAELE